MASILDLLNTTVGEEFIDMAGRETSENKEDVSTVLSIVLPMLLGRMKKNLTDEHGAEKLDKALAAGKHGEQSLKELGNEKPSALEADGKKILTFIFKGDENGITETISRTLQLKESSVAKIVKMAAPMLMSILASQKQKENISTNDLGSLINSLLGSSSKFNSSLVETLLIKDHDSSVINDAKGIILGGGTKGKKDGGILGGMLGSK